MVNIPPLITASSPTSDYVLGNTDAEHERLIRQAARVAPTTERFFREAGVGSGQRVLDIGSGVGDVAMLVARLVGPSGEVVGIERDPKSFTRHSKKPDCPPLPCAWKCRWGRNPTWHNGITTL
jgi:protein-L-isoaspartate O-methyltransferase